MNSTQQLAQLQQDVTDLAGDVQQSNQNLMAKEQALDDAIVDANAQVAEYVNNARSQQAFLRLTRNQRLTTTGAIPDFWSSNANITLTEVQDVAELKAWNERTAEEQALLKAMGLEGIVNLHRGFKIWQMDWSNNATVGIYQRVAATQAVTTAAMTKLLAGSVSGHWAEGASAQWSLSGSFSEGSNMGYHNTHPVFNSPTGSMFFALPATVVGRVPIEANMWGLFPWIGEQSDD